MLRLVKIGILCWLLAGCGLSPIDEANVSSYRLQPVIPTSIVAKRGGGTLLVNTPRAEAGYATERMLYSRHGDDINHYSKHQWVASPNQMLLPLLVESLSNTGGFRAVVGAPYSGLVTLRLDTKILYWLQRFDNQHNRIEIALRATFVRVNSSRILASKTFVMSEPVLALTPQASVEASNRAVRKLLMQITKFCRVNCKQ